MRERRRSARKRIIMEVALCCREAGILRGRTRDIARGGMFIETAPTVQPAADSFEIVFGWIRRGRRRQYRVPAQLVRTASGGIALRFGRLEPAAARALEALLSGPGAERY